MKILVTGGAGYKGIKIVQKLLRKQHQVTVIDNFMYGFDPIMHLVECEKLEVIKHDIRNPINKLKQYDGVIHLAGISGYPACEANPHSAELINVAATRSIIESLGRDQFFINASTTSFYGNSGKICDEETPLEPVSMYGKTKSLAEEVVNEHHQSVNLRFATVFGPSPKLRLDLMVNDFTYKAVTEGVVVLFDSYAKRTFIHVDDAAESYLFTLDNWDRMKGGTFNVGGDNLNFSKKEIAGAIKAYHDYKIIDSDIKDRDVRHFIISFKKIRSLGFTPALTLEDGIKQLLKLYGFYRWSSHFKTI